MESKQSLVSGNLKRYLTIGGIGVAILGTSCYLSQCKNLNKLKTPISRELVMEIFRELKGAYDPIQQQLTKAWEAEAIAKGLEELPKDLKLQILMTSNLIFCLLDSFNS